MRRVRMFIAGVVAVAMISVGASACTPEQTTQFWTGLGNLLTFIVFIHVYGDPVAYTPPTSTTDPSSATTQPPPTTLPSTPSTDPSPTP